MLLVDPVVVESVVVEPVVVDPVVVLLVVVEPVVVDAVVVLLVVVDAVVVEVVLAVVVEPVVVLVVVPQLVTDIDSVDGNRPSKYPFVSPQLWQSPGIESPVANTFVRFAVSEETQSGISERE